MACALHRDTSAHRCGGRPQRVGRRAARRRRTRPPAGSRDYRTGAHFGLRRFILFTPEKDLAGLRSTFVVICSFVVISAKRCRAACSVVSIGSQSQHRVYSSLVSLRLSVSLCLLSSGFASLQWFAFGVLDMNCWILLTTR